MEALRAYQLGAEGVQPFYIGDAGPAVVQGDAALGEGGCEAERRETEGSNLTEERTVFCRAEEVVHVVVRDHVRDLLDQTVSQM